MIQKRLVSKQITEGEAIQFLESRGYVVKKPIIETDVVSPSQIVDFFYQELSKVLPPEQALTLVPDEKADLKAIQRYYDKAKRLDLSRKDASTYLVSSIKALFGHLDSLGLSTTPTSLSFLLSRSGSWIFRKAYEEHQSFLESLEESADIIKWKESLYEDESDLENLRKLRHEELLKDNGQKE